MRGKFPRVQDGNFLRLVNDVLKQVVAPVGKVVEFAAHVERRCLVVEFALAQQIKLAVAAVGPRNLAL
jgi:hypothetical protein